MTPLLVFAALALGPQVEADVVYAKVGETSLKLDLYRPADVPEGTKLPCVVVVHGGAWISGDKKDMAKLCEAFAEAGMAAATVQYRLAPTHKWPAMLDDCQSAVRFLRSKADTYGLDSERFAACGASAGGHLSLLLGMVEAKDGTSSRVSYVLNLFGPTDLSQDFSPALGNSLAQAVLGKPFAEAAAEIQAFSPVTFVTKNSAPVFSIHGTADTLVPIKQVDRLDEAYKAAGVEHEVRKIEGMGHSLPVEKPEVAKALQEGIAWIKAKLGG